MNGFGGGREWMLLRAGWVRGCKWCERRTPGQRSRINGLPVGDARLWVSNRIISFFEGTIMTHLGEEALLRIGFWSK